MPELLCPAGSPEALQAAVDAGAGAIYFGARGFNARHGARNFDPAELQEAIRLCHTYGVKVYVTQNTLVYDKELVAYLRAAESVLQAGADALIVADAGGAMEIHRHFPQAVLHASTQMSGHNSLAPAEMRKLGFSRMVMAREATLGDIRAFTAKEDMELEVFVHGALCVCHSGQCLFSSVVGGRSGNRGECAQPCRLPYGNGYPLSLKDLALAEYIPELIDAGVTSLKIEGRMKSPEYVRDVTTIYRRLLSERRAATAAEMKDLSEIFSRGGFTDGYFIGRIDSRMLGTRSEDDKQSSRALVPFTGMERKLPLDMVATVKAGEPMRLEVSCEGREAMAKGMIPEIAQNAPMTKESFAKNLCKLGNTPFAPGRVEIKIEPGLMVPVSAVNAMRRSAVESLVGTLTERPALLRRAQEPLLKPAGQRKSFRSAVFYDPCQIPPLAREWFDHCYLPLFSYDGSTDGVILPPVIFERDIPAVRAALASAVAQGATEALVGNLGHVELAREAGLALHGDFRLNVCNNSSMTVAEGLGFEDVVLSPELSLPQLRDIRGATAAIVYGRLPLMILEKCVGKEIGGCDKCGNGKNPLALRDRRGIIFPVRREWDHRSVIYNSLPTCLSDQQDELTGAGVVGQHYIFSIESAAEVSDIIRAFREGKALGTQVRRLMKPPRLDG